jgi:hypothetical protein
MTMLAEISSGNTDTADILFLVGFILFVIAFLATLPTFQPGAGAWWKSLLAAGLACVAMGWLLL